MSRPSASVSCAHHSLIAVVSRASPQVKIPEWEPGALCRCRRHELSPRRARAQVTGQTGSPNGTPTTAVCSMPSALVPHQRIAALFISAGRRVRLRMAAAARLMRSTPLYRLAAQKPIGRSCYDTRKNDHIVPRGRIKVNVCPTDLHRVSELPAGYDFARFLICRVPDPQYGLVALLKTLCDNADEPPFQRVWPFFDVSSAVQPLSLFTLLRTYRCSARTGARADSCPEVVSLISWVEKKT